MDSGRAAINLGQSSHTAQSDNSEANWLTEVSDSIIEIFELLHAQLYYRCSEADITAVT